jgi:ankyrin repeat protein
MNWTPIHEATAARNVEMVKLCLTHPKININLRNRDDVLFSYL